MMSRVLSLIPTCIHWNDSVAENFLMSMLLFLFSNLVIDNWQFDLFLASLKYKFMKWASESGFFYRAWMFIHCLWAVGGNRAVSHQGRREDPLFESILLESRYDFSHLFNKDWEWLSLRALIKGYQFCWYYFY